MHYTYPPNLYVYTPTQGELDQKIRDEIAVAARQRIANEIENGAMQPYPLEDVGVQSEVKTLKYVSCICVHISYVCIYIYIFDIYMYIYSYVIPVDDVRERSEANILKSQLFS